MHSHFGPPSKTFKLVSIKVAPSAQESWSCFTLHEDISVSKGRNGDKTEENEKKLDPLPLKNPVSTFRFMVQKWERSISHDIFVVLDLLKGKFYNRANLKYMGFCYKKKRGGTWGNGPISSDGIGEKTLIPIEVADKY